jgi:hypothetical protein
MTTRLYEKDKLFSLMVVEYEPETVTLQIAQTKAKMDKSDIAEVEEQFEEYKKKRGK